MDTTVRINILLIILVAFICGFVVKETFYKKPRGTLPPGVQAVGEAPPAQRPDYGKSLVNKVLSLTPEAEAEPADTYPHYIYDETAIPAESRLFTPNTAFTKTQRGNWMALPTGFTQATTNAYLVYREELPITKELKKYLEEIHGNFVLDVVPFSVFADFNRIFVMLFRTRDKYTDITAMPAWSIATTDLEAQAVYIMENKHFKGNFVHELSHIYYDGFFKPRLSPLWLSEGFAVRMQSAAQTPEENYWLEKEQKIFRSGEYITFDQFIFADDLTAYGKADALTWYAQAFSVVDYLLKNKSRDEFYQFSKNIKEGMPLERAMYRAYGLPFNTVNALEYAWQANLQKDLPRRPIAQGAQ